MNLKELVEDTRTSLSEAMLTNAGKLKLRKNITHLSKYKFWAGKKNLPHLWEHQKAAIGTIAAYLASDISLPERPDHKEAALLKLPTGTGKSGIIAVAARCLPDIKRVLVLTPRTALADQLLRDIKYRFWGNMGFDIEVDKLFVAESSEFGAELEQAYIQRLLPSGCSRAIPEIDKSNRSILVGTHQALFDIRKAAYDEENPDTDCLVLLNKIKRNFDLVIVDEGHYEPAVSWSLGVRDFNLPTFLLSATPYRNDFKSFRVRGRFVFNYPYSSALKNKIIRPVEFIEPALRPKRRTGSIPKKFVEMLKTELPEKLKRAESWFRDGNTIPKVMVRADDIETLIQLQKLIDRAFSTQSVLVHEQARKKQPTSNRFTSVSAAIKARPDSQFWLHQFKLMEGIDDPSFVAIAIFDPMTNARQLIQQIGRATRYSKGNRHFNQVAWIIATSSNLANIRISWARYISYEKYVAKNTSFVVTNEVTLPDRLLEYMADYQYIDGEFRGKFEVESPIHSNDIQLPRSTIVMNHALCSSWMG